MRFRRSRWSRLSLVGLVVLGSLALGLFIANLSVGGNPSGNIRVATTDAGSAAPAATDVASTALPQPAPVDTALLPRPEDVPAESQPGLTPLESTAPLILEGDVFIQEEFASPNPTNFPTRETDTWSVGTVNERYQFKLNGQTLIGASFGLPVENYRLSVDIAVVEGGAGVVFLVREPATSYHIILTADGAYAIERRDNDEVTRLVDWTESPALQRSTGATNRLRIERRGDVITFFADDQVLTDFTVPEGQFDRQFGLVLTSRRGTGLATFDNLLGEELR